MGERMIKNTMFFLNENVITEYFENGAVLYIDESARFFAVDKFGAEILKYIENNQRFTVDDLVVLFHEKYYVSKLELENDLAHYMLKLADIGVIKIEK